MRNGFVVITAVTASLAIPSHKSYAQAFVVRDSAGIRISTSEEPAWARSDAWTIEPGPVVQIGAVDGDDPYLFAGIMDAKAIGPDLIAVVDYRAREIRLFRTDGHFVRRLGGKGQGPGEFGAAPVITFVPPDSVVAWDPRNKRLSWFSTDGELVREVSLLSTPGAASLPMAMVPDAWQLLPDGTVITMGMDLTRREPAIFHRIVQIVEPSGAMVVEVGRFPYGEKVPVSSPQSEGRGTRFIGNPFAPTSPVAARAEPVTVFVGGTSEWQIIAYGAEGAIRQIIRARVPRVPVSRALIAQERARLTEVTGPLGVELAVLERTFDGIELPDSTPAISQILDDGAGQLWVARWRQRPSPAAPVFDVIDLRGRWLGAVHMPPASGEVISIGADRVITLWRDSSDVSHIRLYRVRKPARG